MQSQSYEYEERAFLSEGQFLTIKEKLDEICIQKEIDNKHSFFFVLPNINMSIADSRKETKIKYKGGQLGKGNGFEEIEYNIRRDSLPEAIKLFTRLFDLSPQESFQFRINYRLGDDVEIALKYTEMWGFHLEVERVYVASSDAEKSFRHAESKSKLEQLALTLGFSYITDAEMTIFTEQCRREKKRGEYSNDEFRKQHGVLFGLESREETA